MGRLADFVRRAPITALLEVACVAVFVVMCVRGSFEGHGPAFDDATLRRFGALVPDRVWQGESWRLLSAALVHGDPLHLLFNSWALLTLGPSVERILSPPRALLLFLGAQLGCTTTHVSFGSLSPLVGASGIACGMLGALLVATLRRHDAAAVLERRTLYFWALQVLVFSMAIPGISLLGHLGGGLAGAALMVGLEPAPEHRAQRAVSVVFACVLVAVAVRMALVEPDRPNWNLAKGFDLLEQEHFRDAEPYLRRGLALGSGDYRPEMIHAALGEILIKLDDRDAGRAELAEGVEGGSSGAAELLAHDSDDPHDALRFLSQALEIAPLEPVARPELRDRAIRELVGDWVGAILELAEDRQLPTSADLAPLVHVPDDPAFACVALVRAVVAAAGGDAVPLAQLAEADGGGEGAAGAALVLAFQGDGGLPAVAGALHAALRGVPAELLLPSDGGAPAIEGVAAEPGRP
jgi:membrane associated rhomboid family serine protease